MSSHNFYPSVFNFARFSDGVLLFPEGPMKHIAITFARVFTPLAHA
jgi:hypothetical protein